MSWGNGWSRTATTTFRFNDPAVDVIASLIHGVVPRGSDWFSTCGIGFLTGETTFHPRLVTCIWCVAGVKRERR